MTEPVTTEPTTDAPDTGDKDWAAEAEKWKALARKHEVDARAGKSAAAKLAEIEEAQKTEAQKAADKAAAAEAEVASVPSKVADALRSHLVGLHQIPAEDAELFLTATDPAVLLKQVDRLLARESEGATARKKTGNHVPREGTTQLTGKPQADEREFVRGLFGRPD